MNEPKHRAIMLHGVTPANAPVLDALHQYAQDCERSAAACARILIREGLIARGYMFHERKEADK